MVSFRANNTGVGALKTDHGGSAIMDPNQYRHTDPHGIRRPNARTRTPASRAAAAAPAPAHEDKAAAIEVRARRHGNRPQVIPFLKFTPDNAHRLVRDLGQKTPSYADISQAAHWIALLDRYEASGIRGNSFINNELESGAWRDIVTMNLLLKVDWEAVIARDGKQTKEDWLYLVERELDSSRLTFPVQNPALLRHLTPELFAEVVISTIEVIDGMVRISTKKATDYPARLNLSAFARLSLHSAHGFLQPFMEEARRLYDLNPGSYPRELRISISDFEDNFAMFFASTLSLQGSFTRRARRAS